MGGFRRYVFLMMTLAVFIRLVSSSWWPLPDSVTADQDGRRHRLQYRRDELLALQGRASHWNQDLDLFLDSADHSDSTSNSGRKSTRKRGKRGGVRRRVRAQKTRPPLPTILLSNVRSLRNKLSELDACARYMFEYRDSCLLCFTESWLNKTIDDSTLVLPGFGAPIRLDRRVEDSGKTVGGGVCMYVNERWCKNYVIRDQLCTPDIELLSVSLRPSYLPREFGHIFVVLVYIPPSANYNRAVSLVQSHVQKLESITPDAPKLILGDFNGCTLKSALPTYEQYVKCATRRDKTIDLCFGNIKHAYKSIAKPPIGASDHNSVFLLPTYRQLLKTQNVQTKSVKLWDPESLQRLQGCFDCTDWDMFFDNCDDPCVITDAITSYINFCVDSVIPEKIIKIYPNNKPWVTKELKLLLNEKKRLFCAEDTFQLKLIQKDINCQIQKCKNDYKEKVENQFKTNNSRQAWQGVKNMIGCSKKSSTISTSDDQKYAEDLNAFYARFDTRDYSSERKAVVDKIKNEYCENIIFSPETVKLHFSHLNVRKAPGPDGLSGMVLKKCCEQLCNVFCRLYQMSIDNHVIPALWKKSKIVPVPKKPNSSEMNDFRPVALTSIPMKCFERIILNRLVSDVGHLLDPYQFAYRARRGVEDAKLCILNSVYKHLELPGSYVRILFADFSSAFNTIQPHILLKKLLDMGVNCNILLWIEKFLTFRPQFVKVNSAHSSILYTNTGAPQGCVLSPVLFTLYTNDCTSNSPNNLMVKFADDAALVGLIQENEHSYRENIDSFVTWCEHNFLMLNVRKTKELVINFRTNQGSFSPVCINGDSVEIVNDYKYLGTIFDSKLNWNANTDAVYKKCQQRLHFLRKLRSFNVNERVLSLFYHCFVESVLTFSFQCWYGSLSLVNKSRLEKLVLLAGKISGLPFISLSYLYEKRVLKLSLKILSDSDHVLFTEFVKLPSGRRYLMPRFKTNRYKNSFVPASIRLLNECE